MLLFFVDGVENYVFARIIFIRNIYYDDFQQATFNYRRDIQAIQPLDSRMSIDTAEFYIVRIQLFLRLN